MRRPNTWTQVVHGWTGRGTGKPAARADAIAQIEAAAVGPYEPHILVWRGRVGVAFRWFGTWATQVLDVVCVEDRPLGGPTGLLDRTAAGVCVGYSTREEAVRSLRNHLAQICWEPRDKEVVPLILDKADDADKRDFVRWTRFQMAASAAHAAGATDEDAYAAGVAAREGL